MKTMISVLVNFAAGLIAALLSNVLFGMGYTISRALAFAALFAVIVTLLRIAAGKAGWLHD